MLFQLMDHDSQRVSREARGAVPTLLCARIHETHSAVAHLPITT